MNDNEKLPEVPEVPLKEEAVVESAEVSVKENEKQESTPVTENVCEIESSPAEDITAVADEISENQEKKEEETLKSYHSMTKEELLESLKNILSTGDMEKHKDVTAIKQAFYALTNKDREKKMEEFISAGNELSAFSYTPEVIEEDMKNLLAEFKEKRAAYLEEKEEIKKKNLEEKKRIINEINDISENIDNINQQFPKFQQLQQDFKAGGEVPASAESELWKNYQTAVEQFYDRLKMNKELRDLDFKKNFEVKTKLIEKATSLADLADPIEAFRQLQALHEQWRETGPVARDVREEMWTKFKDASTVVNKRHQDFFQNKKESEQANETAKTELCEKAEAIDFDNFKNFSDWDKATKEILELQAAWKGLGFASRKVNNALFARFRGVCDKFFEAKAEYFKKTKEESKENLQKKEELCEKAEAIAADFNRKGALEQIQTLQKEWKEIGMVRRKQGDEVWKRFCNALDTFYAERKKMFSGKKEEETENLKAKQHVIEQLKAISEEADRKDVIDSIRELQDEWQNIGHVPFKEKDNINGAYRAELDRLFNAFDINESRQRVRRFENEVKKLAGEEGRLDRERQKLERALESRLSEIKTVENNMGFFNVKSNTGGGLVKEMERKIQKLKDEAEEIRQKIKLLDAQG